MSTLVGCFVSCLRERQKWDRRVNIAEQKKRNMDVGKENDSAEKEY